MPRSKKNKKSHRRGTPAARTAQPRTARDSARAAPAGSPPPALVLETSDYARLIPALGGW